LFKAYAISTIAMRADQEIEVTVQGPGIPGAGRRFTFANQERAHLLVDYLNLAFEEGSRDGYEYARLQFAARK
jgi:hypothetical protein